jgi:hypothetical protein
MSLQTIISNSPLEKKAKDALLKRLETEGATDSVLADIKASLKEFIDSGFKELGVTADEQKPFKRSLMNRWHKHKQNTQRNLRTSPSTRLLRRQKRIKRSMVCKRIQ